MRGGGSAEHAQQFGLLQKRLMIVGLALVSALGSAAIHLLVPALPLLSEDLRVSSSVAQYTVTVYLFGLAAGQLLVGPMVDTFGRRKVLLVGLCVYVLGAGLAVIAQSIWLLSACRALQALGAAAGLVTARVVVNDISTPEEATRGQAGLISVILISPAIAPVLGGFLASTSGWRMIMAVQAAAACAALIYAWRSVPETMPQRAEASPQADGQYAQLFRNLPLVRTVLAIALCSASLYIFLAGAPFILVNELHHTASEVGVYFLIIAVAAIAGTAVLSLVEKRVDAFRLGLMICLVGTMCGVAAANANDLWWGYLIFPTSAVSFGVGIAGPAALVHILRLSGDMAGRAASLYGAAQMCLGGIAASLVGALAEPRPSVIALAMLAAIGSAFLLGPRFKREQQD